MVTRSRLTFAWADHACANAPTLYVGPRYQGLFAGHDGSQARVLQCSDASAVAALPLLVRELGSGVKEAYSAYGYGGLVGNFTLCEQDVADLRAFLASEGIVAVFLRHAPFLANQRCWPGVNIELNRHTYAAQLPRQGSFDEYVRGLPQKLRWSIQYARRSGLAVVFRSLAEYPWEQLDAFYRLYAGLMTGKGTGAYYLFSEAFFRAHAAALGAGCELAEIVDPTSGELVAGALFLLDSTDWTHYHLSAASPHGMKLQAMELLLASAMHRYGHQGYGHMHLGGGHALDESDGLSRFKRKFASERLDFACTRLVCDETAYPRERCRLPLAHPGFFLIGDARGLQAQAPNDDPRREDQRCLT
jgi:hypothetical protein